MPHLSGIVELTAILDDTVNGASAVDVALADTGGISGGASAVDVYLAAPGGVLPGASAVDVANNDTIPFWQWQGEALGEYTGVYTFVPPSWRWEGVADSQYRPEITIPQTFAFEGEATMEWAYTKIFTFALEGEAESGFSGFVRRTAGFELEANADLEFNGVVKLFGEFGFEGNAQAQFNPNPPSSFQMVGEAELEFTGRKKTIFTFPWVGKATFGLEEQLYRPVVNPPLAGDLINPADPNSLLFTVAGTPIDLGTNCFFNLDSLRISYDGKSLNFSEIATPEIGFPTFDPEDEVTLDFDFTGTGSMFQRIFTGKIKNRTHVGENNNEAIEYEALGFYQIANEITVLNTAGRPDIIFTAGTTVTTVTPFGAEIRQTFTIPIATAIQEVFERASPDLAAAGIPATIGNPGLEQFSGFISDTVRLNNVGFASAVQQLASGESGVKLYYDDASQTWQFHNLLTAPTNIVNVCSVNVESLNFDVSTQDRFTAIVLYTEQEDEQDNSILYQEEGLLESGLQLQRAEISLRPLWLPELEDDWNLLTANQPNPFTLENEYTWVYRRWTFDQDIDRLPGTPANLRAKIKYWGGEERWVPINGRLIENRRLFIARFHVFTRGDPYIPGDVIGPEEVTLTYYQRGGFFNNPSSVTTITSAGTSITIVTTIPQQDLLTSVRFPTAGFTGTAFTQYGVERVLYETVSRDEVTIENAVGRLNLYKDVVVEGDVPIGGDPIEQFIELNAKVRVQHPTKKTGIESIDAFLTEYIYNFGKRGLSTLNLTSDTAGLLNT